MNFPSAKSAFRDMRSKGAQSWQCLRPLRRPSPSLSNTPIARHGLGYRPAAARIEPRRPPRHVGDMLPMPISIRSTRNAERNRTGNLVGANADIMTGSKSQTASFRILPSPWDAPPREMPPLLRTLLRPCRIGENPPTRSRPGRRNMRNYAETEISRAKCATGIPKQRPSPYRNPPRPGGGRRRAPIHGLRRTTDHSPSKPFRLQRKRS